MIVVIDSTALAMLICPEAQAPNDPVTGEQTSHAQARVEKFCRQLEENADILMIPTPVLAEVLVRAGPEGSKILESLQGQAFVRVKPFDQAAAIEFAIMTQEAIANGHKGGGHSQPWQRVKFDRQIISIARVSGADKVYSDDDALKNYCGLVGLDAFSTWDLSVPETVDNLFTVTGVPEQGVPDTSVSHAAPSPKLSSGRKINLDDD